MLKYIKKFPRNFAKIVDAPFSNCSNLGTTLLNKFLLFVGIEIWNIWTVSLTNSSLIHAQVLHQVIIQVIRRRHHHRVMVQLFQGLRRIMDQLVSVLHHHRIMIQ